ncbi:hypothetical protein AB0L82_35190 [Nocardia sp. NPDC052001]|uniref:hypothetical protein n=1 Tax=Nocardia sp. NPDC052001 TaxID=3154853 RepID=UPI0034203EB3
MRRTLVLVLAVTVAALSAAVVVLMLRPTHTHTHTPDSGHSHDGDSEFEITGPVPSGAGPGVAAQQGLSAMFSWSPSTDASPGAGLSRAKPWLTGQLATDADTPPAVGIKPLTEWAQWRAGGDIVVATATTSQVTTPAAGRALVKLTLTQTVLHRDGSSTRWRVMDIEATTLASPDGWRLSGYRVTG